MNMSRTIVVLCAALMTLAACQHPLYHHNPASYVPPEQVVYDRVPGFGVSGTDLLEWAQKSGPGSGEPAVPATLDAPKGLRIRWLGTAGFELSDDDTAILVDPFVSRPEVNPLISDKAQFRLDIDTAAVD